MHVILHTLGLVIEHLTLAHLLLLVKNLSWLNANVYSLELHKAHATSEFVIVV